MFLLLAALLSLLLLLLGRCMLLSIQIHTWKLWEYLHRTEDPPLAPQWWETQTVFSRPYREDSDVTNAVAEQGLHMHLTARWAPKSCQCSVFAVLLGWVLQPLPLQLLSPSAADGIEQIERQKDSSDNALTVPALNKHNKLSSHSLVWSTKGYSQDSN